MNQYTQSMLMNYRRRGCENYAVVIPLFRKAFMVLWCWWLVGIDGQFVAPFSQASWTWICWRTRWNWSLRRQNLAAVLHLSPNVVRRTILASMLKRRHCFIPYLQNDGDEWFQVTAVAPFCLHWFLPKAQPGTKPRSPEALLCKAPKASFILSAAVPLLLRPCSGACCSL